MRFVLEPGREARRGDFRTARFSEVLSDPRMSQRGRQLLVRGGGVPPRLTRGRAIAEHRSSEGRRVAMVAEPPTPPRGRRLGKPPEVPLQSQRIEDGLILLPVARRPIWGEAVTPPGVRKVAQGPRRCGHARRPRAEPADDVGFRPEEVHRASGEDDVVPPVRRWDQAVEEQRTVAAGRAVAHLDGELVTAVGAGGGYDAVDSQSGADAEGVPGAVRVPVAIGGVHAVRRRDRREGVGHADLARVAVEDQRVCVVQPLPCRADCGNAGVEAMCHLDGQRRAAEFDQQRIRVAAHVEVGAIHAGIMAPSRRVGGRPDALAERAQAAPMHGVTAKLLPCWWTQLPVSRTISRHPFLVGAFGLL
jgi:hypothetical protein